jgi:steroid 5-alpha reductase family enzyme
MMTLVWIWALRLFGHLFLRNKGKPEDRRYAEMRNKRTAFWFKSLYVVFLLQAVLAWIIGLPQYAAVASTAPLGWLDAAGVVLFVFGLVWESLADWQLARFLARRTNSNAVMDQGVWRYSRHPNYFGEFCLWWGLWLIALAGGGAWTAIGPLLLSFFLLKVSGVSLLEKDISERRPAYQAYVRRTSAFIPLPPREAD